jgi:hypothetical protein
MADSEGYWPRCRKKLSSASARGRRGGLSPVRTTNEKGPNGCVVTAVLHVTDTRLSVAEMRLKRQK